jgi:hypothetical protein
MRTILVNAILAALIVLYILYLFKPSTFHHRIARAHK